MDELIDGIITESSMISLNNDSLSRLPDSVIIPNYDRNSLTAGIVHIGVGNFHRAHLAWYLHRLMQNGQAYDWAIIGAGVREHDKIMRNKLLAQDCLTTLIELDPAGGQATEVTGAMIDFLPVEPENQPLIDAMARPEIKIVSLTITEGGYYLDSTTGKLDCGHADILHDAAHPQTPKTAFGAIVAALKLRRERGITSFSCLCCDNLQANGAILRQTVVGLARLSDPELASWIDSQSAFPNSMVDCIVPATGRGELELAQRLGIDDAAPVTHEDFRQWVIEDSFCQGRPDWHLVGAEFSDHVHLHEAQKIRILNGGHQILANVAEVMGVTTISDAISHPLIYGFFHKVLTTEIIPHVTELDNMPVTNYLEVIEKRFANPKIIDTVRRVAFDGSARHAGFILPSIRDGLAKESQIAGLALVEALWARMCEGHRENGSVIDPNDPIWERLRNTASQARIRPLAWLEMDDIYGDLAKDKRFAPAFEQALHAIYTDGVAPTIQQYLEATD